MYDPRSVTPTTLVEADETTAPSASTQPDATSDDHALLVAQRAYGICGKPDCDRPISSWCARCHTKTCAHHARTVQLHPDYRPATLCYRCLREAIFDEDPATLIIARPAYDPAEQWPSEPHAAWWLACAVQRYIRLIEIGAPTPLRARELGLIEEHTQHVRQSLEQSGQ